MKRILLLLALPLCAQAYEPEHAKNSIAHDLANCAAYFTLASGAPGVDPSTKEKLDTAAETSLSASAELTSEKVALARMQTGFQEMTEDMARKWDNLSVVAAKYSDFCRDLLNDPEGRMKYWLDKSD